jgi:uncharacterized protein (TIGR00730 family)
MIYNICIFCGSRKGRDASYAEAARDLGHLVAKRRLRLVYGGGGTGLMGEIARAALSAGGEVTGVMPHFLVEKEAALSPQPDLRIVHSMHERKAVLAEISDAFIALPGGIGTLEELFEIWSHAQLGLHAKPIGLLNVNGYFDDLIRFCDASVDCGFTRAERRNLLVVGDNPSDLLGRLLASAATNDGILPATDQASMFKSSVSP